jgi:hypothetical protein
VTALAVSLIGSPLDPSKCPKVKPDGKQCGNIPGKATDHVGYGYCHKHSGATPSGRKHGAKLAAIAAMRETGEVDVNPLDAMLYTVRRASHLAAYYRLQAEAIELEGADATILFALEREALGDLNQWADRAIKAGVAERMVRIAEGTGERLASAYEESLEGEDIPPEQLKRIVAKFAAALGRLEREQPAITAKATDT